MKIAIFILVSQIMEFHLAYKKYFRHFLVKFIIYTVSLPSSRSNENQFQLVDLVIGRLWCYYFGL